MSDKIRIFDEQISRKPDRYPWAYEFIDAMDSGHWTDKEFSFASDIQDFNVALSPQIKECVIRTLSAISQVETEVRVYWGKLGENLPHPSLIDLGFKLAAIEVTHSQAYGRLLEELGIEDVFEKNLKLPFFKGRVDYLRKYRKKEYSDKKKQYLYAVTLFTLFVENVSLFSQFYIVNWLNRHKNVLKSVTQQTAYTAKEERIHSMVGIKIINVIRDEYPELFDQDLEEKIIHEAKEAFKAESNIIDWALEGVTEDGLNPEVLKEFVKNRINDSLIEIGYRKAFEIDEFLIKQTLWFDEEVLGNTSTDFFARRPVEYSKKSQSFDTDDLF
jgi:ribonucleoside-diphosphate reductase beta chain